MSMNQHLEKERDNAHLFHCSCVSLLCSAPGANCAKLSVLRVVFSGVLGLATRQHTHVFGYVTTAESAGCRGHARRSPRPRNLLRTRVPLYGLPSDPRAVNPHDEDSRVKRCGECRAFRAIHPMVIKLNLHESHPRAPDSNIYIYIYIERERERCV